MSSKTPAMQHLELEIPLQATRERAWQALTEEVDRWWLADYRACGEGSRLSLDPRPGGLLLEAHEDGTQLAWYTVQMVQPGRALYLVGHTAPDWGGPVLSMLKLQLNERAGGCTLLLSDAMTGRIDEQVAEGTERGWRALFGDGLGGWLAC